MRVTELDLDDLAHLDHLTAGCVRATLTTLVRVHESEVVDLQLDEYRTGGFVVLLHGLVGDAVVASYRLVLPVDIADYQAHLTVLRLHVDCVLKKAARLKRCRELNGTVPIPSNQEVGEGTPRLSMRRKLPP